MLWIAHRHLLSSCWLPLLTGCPSRGCKCGVLEPPGLVLIGHFICKAEALVATGQLLRLPPDVDAARSHAS
ncbi:hypothetical protein QBC39DRAFT_339302 [Podospora conica]|nr:hypothetical protein QBC39DRAFT_339302 [Schizothecium conicum]